MTNADHPAIAQARQFLRALFFCVGLAAATRSSAATFTVSKTADTNDGVCDADCSLREAIIASNTTAGADRIVLGSGLTYTLTLGPADAAGALVPGSGDLDITDAVTIDGNGSTIDAAGLDRVFDIQGTFTVTINNLSIKGGSAPGFLSSGGGISIRSATVILNNCTVSNNSSALESGSRDDGGGIAVIGSYDGPSGVANLAQLTLNGSVVSGNAAANGGGILCALCALTISGSVIATNTADGEGGGIDLVGDASTLSMADSDLAGNTAGTRGGGLSVPFGTSTSTLTVSRIAVNTAPTGSAIFNNAGTINVENNWWGCNYGPGTGGAGCTGTPNNVSGPFLMTRYLVLKASAAPPTIPFNATSTITADLTFNSLSASTVAGGTLPNGTLVGFTATLGTLAAPSSPLTNGKATNVYTAVGPKGVAAITATVDGQAVSTPLNVGYQAFTDDPLVPGTTPIRAVHITELRTRINAIRAQHGLGAFAFTTPALTAGTVVQAQHILDLRTALAQAYTAAALTPPVYTDASLASGGVIKAVHVTEIRAAIVAIE